MKHSVWFWVCASMFVASVIGFIIHDYQRDVQHMVWSGFSGAMWFRLLEREADK